MNEFSIELGTTNSVANPVDTTLLKEKQKPRNMGLGRLDEPNLIFVRKFRWTMEGKGIPEHWFAKVNFDFKAKELLLQVVEIIDTTKYDINIHTWLEKELSEETLTFKTYDGCGQELYQYEFKSLTLLEDEAGFDYSVSDVSARKIKLKYKDCIRKPLYVKQEDNPLVGKFKKNNPPKEKFLYTTQLETTDGLVTHEFVVRPNARPSLNIEETEYNFLNAKTWIPGKHQWEDMIFSMDKDAGRQFIRNFSVVKDADVMLHLLDMSQSKLETWTLKQADIKSFKEVEGKDDNYYEIVVKFETVEYVNHAKEERKHESKSC